MYHRVLLLPNGNHGCIHSSTIVSTRFSLNFLTSFLDFTLVMNISITLEYIIKTVSLILCKFISASKHILYCEVLQLVNVCQISVIFEHIKTNTTYSMLVELPILPEHLSSLALCVCFVDRCLSFCPFLLWPLCCLFFFDIRILIISLVSSNTSYLWLVKIVY